MTAQKKVLEALSDSGTTLLVNLAELTTQIDRARAKLTSILTDSATQMTAVTTSEDQLQGLKTRQRDIEIELSKWSAC